MLDVAGNEGGLASQGVGGDCDVEILQGAAGLFELTLDAADVQVKNLQPYFADKVTLANSDGNVSLKGQLKVSKDKDQAISAQFKGNGSITDFVSFDPQAGEEFLKWKNLRLGEMDYDSGRFAFRIKEVLWQDFYNKIIVFEDSSVNLKAVMKGPSGQGVEPLEADEPENGRHAPGARFRHAGLCSGQRREEAIQSFGVRNVTALHATEKGVQLIDFRVR